tara:strand:+ start:1110 stop:2663 length:1554 start_codon:yes stop_codon:yes gene_type:complete
MARLDADLTVKTGQGNDYVCSMTDQYTEVLTTKQKVDNTNAFITLASLGSTIAGIGASAGQRLKGAKLIVIKNNSPVAIEVQLRYAEWLDSSNIDQTNSVDLGPGSATTSRQLSLCLGANEYVVLPNQWAVGYAEDASAGNAKTIDNQGGYDVDTNLYVAASDILLDEGSNITNSVTNFTVDDGDYFRAGDLIRLDNEIMEVTSVSTNELYVIRATHGSSAATHNDDVAIRLPFFNAYSNFNKYTYSQTNTSGKFKSMNLFGYGRSKTYPTGIVKGSLALKFYNNGYQEFGMSGVTESTHSGLAASTTYQFNITVDGGSEFANLAFTTDGTNLNFGGANGVISKIQEALNTQYYTSGNLFEKRVTVGIVNGDIRFSSSNRTRASAISLAAPGSGTTPFGVGRIPAIGSIESAVASVLPDDTIFDRSDYIESKNQAAFAYDDGKGNIRGVASGSINYETGAIDITGPADAEFVVSFNYDSAHSGGTNETANQQNTIKEISARSMNSKIDAEVEILGFV